MSRIFYVVYLPDNVVGTCVDVFRALINPGTKNHAHITVRGPYEGFQDPSAWADDAMELPIKIGAPATFYSNTQNTVYLSVDAPALRKVWHKPRYPDGTPHLTLYDGAWRGLADEVLRITTKYPVTFDFTACGLKWMISSDVPPKPLWDRLDRDRVEPLIKLPLNVDPMDMPERTRVAIAERVWAAASRLQGHDPKST